MSSSISDSISDNGDIVIVGAGPGGSTAAAILAAKGYRTVVLESRRHPREHVGESLLPHAWKYLDRSGAAAAVAREGFVVKKGGTVAWGDRIHQVSFAAFGYERPALHVERDRFDMLLAQNAVAAGASLHEEVVVREIEQLDDGTMKVYYRAGSQEGSVRCREVIDASGQAALIGRKQKLRVLDEDFRFMGIWGYFQDSKYVDSEGKARDFAEVADVAPTTFVSSVGENQGWCWHIPLRRTTSLGLVLPHAEFGGRGASPQDREAWFEDTCRAIPIVDQLLENATFEAESLRITRDYSYHSTRYAGPGWFLVGDAAAFVDPIFSLGVTFALYSGYLAAWAVDRGLRRPGTMERCRSLYSFELERRIDMARAIALPRYKGRMSESARDAKVMTHHRVAIDRERVSPASCAEGSVVGRSAGWRHCSGTGRRVAAGQDACFPALERTKGPGSQRSYAASWQHNSDGRLPDEAPGGGIQAALSVPTAPCCWSYAAAWRHSNQEAAQECPAKSTHFRCLDGNRGKNSRKIRREGDIIQ
ncbi:MAG: NAD(P)/FAD-dependent oxidoreductase [bacterium]|nr:NAD(P)/FAD-dependent oxidoreductase [bacterium]